MDITFCLPAAPYTPLDNHLGYKAADYVAKGVANGAAPSRCTIKGGKPIIRGLNCALQG